MKKRFRAILALLALSVPSTLMVASATNQQFKNNNFEVVQNYELTPQVSSQLKEINVNKQIITTVVDSSKDNNYPYLGTYTNVRTKDNDFNLKRGYWHTSKNLFEVARIHATRDFGYEDMDDLLNHYQTISLDYLFNANFWYNSGWYRRWAMHTNNPKSVPLDKWERGTYQITKYTLPEAKHTTNHYTFDQVRFTKLRFRTYKLTTDKTEPLKYLASGVHIWMQRTMDNKEMLIFAETGSYFDHHGGLELATYMNFLPLKIRIS